MPASNAARSVSASGTGRPVPASNNLSVPGHLLIFAIVTCTLCLIAAFKPILERNRIEAEGRHVVYASLFAEKGLSEAVEDIITSPGRPASGRKSKFCRGDDSGCLFYRETVMLPVTGPDGLARVIVCVSWESRSGVKCLRISGAGSTLSELEQLAYFEK